MIGLVCDLHLVDKHPQKVLWENRILYKMVVPQSMGDCWWVLGVDEYLNLPKGFEYKDFGDLSGFVGYGLSVEDVIGLQGFYTEPLVKELPQSENREYIPSNLKVKIFGIELNGYSNGELNG